MYESPFRRCKVVLTITRGDESARRCGEPIELERSADAVQRCRGEAALQEQALKASWGGWRTYRLRRWSRLARYQGLPIL